MNEAFEKWLLMNARYYSGKKAVAQAAFEAGREQAAERCLALTIAHQEHDEFWHFGGRHRCGYVLEVEIRKEFGV